MITFQNIIQLNEILNEGAIPVKIHLSDACGGASMWIEELNGFKEDNSTVLYQIIKEYFDSRYTNIKFSEDKKSFWTI